MSDFPTKRETVPIATAVCCFCRPPRILYPDGTVGGVWLGGASSDGMCRKCEAEYRAELKKVKGR